MAAETQTLEPTYATAKGFALTSGFWMMVATFFGLLGATELVAPDLTENMGGIVFGRVRPTHVNLVLFGFVTPGLLSAAFYFIPRLLRTRLFSERLGVFTVVAWNVALVGAVASLAAGFTQGREYAGADLAHRHHGGGRLQPGLLQFHHDRQKPQRTDPVRLGLVRAGRHHPHRPAPSPWAT